MSMKGWRARRREQAARLAGGAAEELADVGCTSCGRVMEGRAAFTVHADQGRCLPDGAFGQLVPLPGNRWGLRWRHPEARG